MQTAHTSEVGAMANPYGISAKPLHSSEHAQVVHIELNPGESLRRHITPVDVIFYMLEGSGVVEIGAATKEPVA